MTNDPARERMREKKSAGSPWPSKERFPILPVLFEQITAIIDPEPHPAALNMALDEALLQRALEPTLRVYRWSEPAVSLGYFSRFAEAEKAAAGRAMVRRWTGGGLVEHGDDITYTLIVPRDAAFFQHAPELSGAELRATSARRPLSLNHRAIRSWISRYESSGVYSKKAASRGTMSV